MKKFHVKLTLKNGEYITIFATIDEIVANYLPEMHVNADAQNGQDTQKIVKTEIS